MIQSSDRAGAPLATDQNGQDTDARFVGKYV